MSVLAQTRYVTELDYLIMETESEHKHEYVDGYAMAGAGERHNRIPCESSRLFSARC